MLLRPRSALLAISVLLAIAVAAATIPDGAAAQEGEDAAPAEVIIDLRVWQRVSEPGEIWVSARPSGGDWRALGTIRFPLDQGHSPDGRYRYRDLTVAGAVVRIWQHASEPGRISVCAYPCPDPALRTIPHPLGAIGLPLDDGHSRNGAYRYGALTVATVPGSPALLADRVQLLRLRDTLAGRGTLDWEHDTAMTTWTGVTVGGTPPRVTKLNLADSGLRGRLPGLLGNLTGLTELRLDGNALTGAVPSKLGQLTNLTHAYLGGNALTRCVPPPLRTVANNDIASLGLPDCLPPLVASPGEQLLTDGSYLYRHGEDGPVLIFDVPAGIRMTIDGVVTGEAPAGGPPAGEGLLLRDADGDSRTGFDLATGGEWSRSVDPDAAGIPALFDRIIASAWFGAPDTPSTGPPTLTAVAGDHEGEILLEWTIARAGALRWQFRWWKPGVDAAWGAWTDIPGSDAGTTSLRILGLHAEQLYVFEVRPWTRAGAGDAYEAVTGVALRAGADGIPFAFPGQVLEGGRTFRVDGTPYTFTAPRGLGVALGAVTRTPEGSTRIRWEEPVSGSFVLYDASSGAAVERVTNDGAPAGVEALFDQLLDSIRRR